MYINTQRENYFYNGKFHTHIFQKLDQFPGGKCFIHSSKHHKDNNIVTTMNMRSNLAWTLEYTIGSDTDCCLCDTIPLSKKWWLLENWTVWVKVNYFEIVDKIVAILFRPRCVLISFFIFLQNTHSGNHCFLHGWKSYFITCKMHFQSVLYIPPYKN